MVIASEDKYAVESYFRRFRTRKVYVVVLPTEHGRSSPQDVMARLDKYKQNEAIIEGDEFWICIDTDHWVRSNHLHNLYKCFKSAGKSDMTSPSAIPALSFGFCCTIWTWPYC